jgi:hypothetical protein
MFWHGRALALPVMNLFYAVSTLVLLAATLVALFQQRFSLSPPIQRTALWLAFGFLAVAFGFYALLSVQFDFNNCFYPSRAHPFFTSGRLMLGSLIPFLILIACGLDCILGRISLNVKLLILFMLLLFMLAMETVTNWAVFTSEYNWFHL